MTFPKPPPIDVLLLRTQECDCLRMMLDDANKKAARILAQRDRLKAMVQEALVQRDAAIARADGMERAGAEQAKRAEENYTALIAARAAHAEAMELLREVRGPSPLTEYGLDELRSRIDAHLAKHGGGE